MPVYITPHEHIGVSTVNYMQGREMLSAISASQNPAQHGCPGVAGQFTAHESQYGHATQVCDSIQRPIATAVSGGIAHTAISTHKQHPRPAGLFSQNCDTAKVTPSGGSATHSGGSVPNKAAPRARIPTGGLATQCYLTGDDFLSYASRSPATKSRVPSPPTVEENPVYISDAEGEGGSTLSFMTSGSYNDEIGSRLATYAQAHQGAHRNTDRTFDGDDDFADFQMAGHDSSNIPATAQHKSQALER